MQEIYSKLTELMRTNPKLAIATVVSVTGSTPREVGVKMVVLQDGTIEGTIGGGKLEHLVIQDSMSAMQIGEGVLKKYDLKPEEHDGIGMECGGEVTVFIEVLQKGERLLILGGGHIGLALYKMAIETDFSVVVVDDRPEFVSIERFPIAEQLLNTRVDDPKVFELVDENTYIVIVTHEHRQDKLAVKSLIDLSYKYLGMIGSRRKVKQTMIELQQEGIPVSKLDNVFSPIGLDINSETPAEIAVSILAELINVRYTGKPSLISLKKLNKQEHQMKDEKRGGE
jgi:xanthine dehydrogenase accessory factor